MINHELSNYDLVEGIEFDGLMPHVMEVNETIGASDMSTKMFGSDATGADALEVVDSEAFFEVSGVTF